MKTRTIGLVAMTGIVCSAVYVFRASTASADDDGPPRSLSGTFLSEFDYLGVRLHCTPQINSDGTLRISDESDFGGVDGIRSAPAYGTWGWSGNRSIAGTALAMCFDMQGAPIGILRYDFHTQFDRQFEIGDSVLDLRIYAPGQDPLDPAQGVAFNPPQLHSHARRLHVP